jgi:hypothetical protein
MPAGFHISDIRSRPASGRQPDTVGKPSRWQTSIGTPARSLETPGEALAYTTGCGLLKQPDKQKLGSIAYARMRPHFAQVAPGLVGQRSIERGFAAADLDSRSDFA